MKKIIALFVMALLVLTACGPEEPATDTAVPPPSDTASLAAQMAWDQTPEDDRDAMCLGLYAYGREWSMRQIQAGGNQSDADALTAVALIERECDAR